MRFVALGCFVMLTACPGVGVPKDASVVYGCTDLDGGFGDAGSLKVDAYCAALVASLCARQTACGLTQTLEGCQGRLDASVELSACEFLKSGVGAGRIAFDCGAAADCVAPPSG
jgi:hypothetical protein